MKIDRHAIACRHRLEAWGLEAWGLEVWERRGKGGGVRTAHSDVIAKTAEC